MPYYIGKTKKNTQGQQRRSIRVLGSANFMKGFESNQNLDSCRKNSGTGIPAVENCNNDSSPPETEANGNPKIIRSSSNVNIENATGTNESKEEPPIGSPSNESVVGSLPRTLSTSVLRIKHRRSFWERVVG